MKIFSFLLLLLTAFSMHALQVVDLGTGSITTDSVLAAPERNVEYTDDGIIVTYKFRNIGIEEDDIYTGTYRLELPGFIIGNEPGLPALPSGQDSFVVPPYSDPCVDMLYCEYKELKYRVAPSRAPRSLRDTVRYSLSTVPVIEPYTGFWPGSVCSDLESDTYRRQLIARVKITPVQYDYLSGTVRVCTEFSYKVKFTSGGSWADITYEPGSLLNPNSTLKPQGTTPLAMNAAPASYREPGTSVNADAGYLIVSVPEFESALHEFVKWKKRLGYSVTELYDDNWTPDKVKDAVRTQYESDSTLMYLLIVGDYSRVPACKHSYLYSSVQDGIVLSDIDYGIIGDNAHFQPDIYRGRWPATDKSELEKIIDKTMWYEQAPSLNSDFYRRASHFSYFEDGDVDGVRTDAQDGVEDSRFVRTCEDIRTYLMDNYDYDIDRFYSTCTNNLTVWPKSWNTYYADGGDLPADLLYENGFPWGSGQSASELVAAVNDGVSYILHIGHGYYNGWSFGNLDTFNNEEDISRMQNYEQLPVVFDYACLTGYFGNRECFVWNFLKKPNGGGVAAFAASNVSWYGENERFASLMFNAIWPNPGFSIAGSRYDIYDGFPVIQPSESIKQLGQILDYANSGMMDNSNLGLYTKRAYHCFGDPSMYFRTETPEILDDKVDVQHTGSGTHVSVYDKDAYIAFYDPIKDKSTRYYGNEAAYFTDDKDGGKYVDVVVYTPNSVPVIVYGEDYYGEITEPAEESRIVGYHDPRDHSRVDIKYYLNSKDAKKSVEMLIVDLATNNIISSAPVDKSITDQVTSISMRCHGGVMVASLMIDRYPVSNMKMYISK